MIWFNLIQTVSEGKHSILTHKNSLQRISDKIFLFFDKKNWGKEFKLRIFFEKSIWIFFFKIFFHIWTKVKTDKSDVFQNQILTVFLLKQLS